MEKKFFNLLIVLTLLIIALFLVSYYVGYNEGVKKGKGQSTTQIVYKPGKTIVDTLKIPQPYKVTVIDSIPKPYKVIEKDTTWLPVDTMNILKDYYSTRSYALSTVNDTVGKFTADVTVSENKIQKSILSIQPIIKTVTENTVVEKVDVLSFYGVVGSNIDLNVFKVGAGLEIGNKYILGVSGMMLGQQKGYTIDLGVKF